MAVGALLAIGLLRGLAWAGPWEASSPQGMTVRIHQDSYRTRDFYLLQRLYPDGTLDASFGEAGTTLFRLGPDNEGPAALRMDAQGRLWVAGASVETGAPASSVVLRFLPNGIPDPSWGAEGRVTSRAAGRSTRALDLMPLADGSALVVGLVVDAQGQERAGAWRLLPDGAVDLRFGLGGLWEDQGAGYTEIKGLQSGGDGSAALLMLRTDGSRVAVEAWAWRPGETRLRLAAEAAGPGPSANGLQWSRGEWRLGAGSLPPDRDASGPAAADPLGSVRNEVSPNAAAQESPFAPGGAAAAAVGASGPAGDSSGTAALWWAALAVSSAAACALLWHWRRRSMSR